METANTALVLRPGATDDEAPVALQTDLQVDLAETRERLGIPDPDGPPLLPDVAEMEHLKQMIHEEEQAKMEALQAAAELQLQLANTQAEAARSKTQYFGVPKSRGALTRAESELAETNTKLHAAKKELDFEKRSRRAESIQAAAKISSLERALSVAVAATSASESTKGHPMFLRIALGAAAAVALAAGITAIVMHRQIPVSANDSVSASTQQPRAGGLPAAPDFTQSYDRLSQALAALPGRDAEDILRQVQKSGRGCAIRWNDGEPSLLFGGQSSGAAKKPSSLPDALGQCAEAVEKLH